MRLKVQTLATGCICYQQHQIRPGEFFFLLVVFVGCICRHRHVYVVVFGYRCRGLCDYIMLSQSSCFDGRRVYQKRPRRSLMRNEFSRLVMLSESTKLDLLCQDTAIVVFAFEEIAYIIIIIHYYYYLFFVLVARLKSMGT